MSSAPDVVIGAGHNGLIAACYLARAGRDVLVLEALDRPGGGSRTEATIDGHPDARFDLHSVAHNLLNLTDIPEELELAAAGLEYREMDPFAVAVRADGRMVRFARSLDETVESIAATDRAEAEAYRRFVETATPVVQAVLPAIRGDRGAAGAARVGRSALHALARGGFGVVADALGPYDSLLRRHLRSDLTRGPVAAFAAHGGVGPNQAGGALYALWQAAYHLGGQWHALGGSQALTDALVRRLTALGGQIRCGVPVSGIEAGGGRIAGVRLADGTRLAARTVVAAIDPTVALLQLLEPHLDGPVGTRLAAARRSNVVQAVVHVLCDRLPSYRSGRPEDGHGLQSFVDRLDDLTSAWALAEVGRLAERPPLYAFTTSSLDPALAPRGHHPVYLACPAAPARVEGGWAAATPRLLEACLDTVEQRAPGFRDSVVGVSVRTPEDMEAEGWVGAHPMHLDLSLDQVGPFRPVPGLGRWRTPVEGLYVSGAGTNPTGGIVGTPGRGAARAVLADARRRRR